MIVFQYHGVIRYHTSRLLCADLLICTGMKVYAEYNMGEQRNQSYKDDALMIRHVTYVDILKY